MMWFYLHLHIDMWCPCELFVVVLFQCLFCVDLKLLMFRSKKKFKLWISCTRSSMILIGRINVISN